MRLKNIMGQKKYAHLLLVVFLVLVVFTTVQASTLGAKLRLLEDKETRLLTENLKVEQNLAEEDSLTKISRLAEDLKFIKPQRVIYPEETEKVVFGLR